VIQPNAAALDIGATLIHAALPPGRSPEPVRIFRTFTPDLRALADWLVEHGITTVALEATGVFWIPVFQILEQRHLEVCLVNPRHVKHPRGRKSDVSDPPTQRVPGSSSSTPPVCSSLPFGRRMPSAPSGPSCAIATNWSPRARPRSSTCKRRSAR
jgi:hypothetical protein